MQDDSFLGFLDMLLLDLPKPPPAATPMLVLGAERDNMLTAGEIYAAARAWSAELDIIPGVAHNMMLELRWQAVAERIRDWLTPTTLAWKAPPISSHA